MIHKQVVSQKTSSSGSRSEGGDFFTPITIELVLEDGATYYGMKIQSSGAGRGEVVFNTGMTGYVESLTDPSYAGQILVFTYPLIGNYGVHEAARESKKIHVGGVVVSEAADGSPDSGFDASLLHWLSSQDIPLIVGVDTRALTKHLRTRGSMFGTIGQDTIATRATKSQFISVDRPVEFGSEHAKKIILIDCGAKENIVRSLVGKGLHVKRVPYDYDFSKEPYDGIVLSNGPGDPTDYVQTIRQVAKALKQAKPVFGICLGSQIMGLAAGAKTYKLTFGHRGHNQPCIESDSNRCFITSQNHGYAIDEKTLPDGWKVSFRNLNDGSVEGIRHAHKPFFSVQFHPEACPGPTDTGWLFDSFIGLL